MIPPCVTCAEDPVRFDEAFTLSSSASAKFVIYAVVEPVKSMVNLLASNSMRPVLLLEIISVDRSALSILVNARLLLVDIALPSPETRPLL